MVKWLHYIYGKAFLFYERIKGFSAQVVFMWAVIYKLFWIQNPFGYDENTASK